MLKYVNLFLTGLILYGVVRESMDYNSNAESDLLERVIDDLPVRVVRSELELSEGNIRNLMKLCYLALSTTDDNDYDLIKRKANEYLLLETLRIVCLLIPEYTVIRVIYDNGDIRYIIRGLSGIIGSELNFDELFCKAKVLTKKTTNEADRMYGSD